MRDDDTSALREALARRPTSSMIIVERRRAVPPIIETFPISSGAAREIVCDLQVAAWNSLVDGYRTGKLDL